MLRLHSLLQSHASQVVWTSWLFGFNKSMTFFLLHHKMTKPMLTRQVCLHADLKTHSGMKTRIQQCT